MNPTILVQQEPRGPSIQIEIPVTLNGQFQVPFPDQPQLRSKMDQKIVIKGIRLITPDVLSNAWLSGNANAPVTELQKMSATFYAEGWEKGQKIPLLTLNGMQLQGGTAPNAQEWTRVDDWVNVDWPKCFLTFSNGTGGSAGATYSVVMDILYVKLDAQNNEIKRAS